MNQFQLEFVQFWFQSEFPEHDRSVRINTFQWRGPRRAYLIYAIGLHVLPFRGCYCPKAVTVARFLLSQSCQYHKIVIVTKLLLLWSFYDHKVVTVTKLFLLRGCCKIVNVYTLAIFTKLLLLKYLLSHSCYFYKVITVTKLLFY